MSYQRFSVNFSLPKDCAIRTGARVNNASVNSWPNASIFTKDMLGGKYIGKYSTGDKFFELSETFKEHSNITVYVRCCAISNGPLYGF
jgi:hypothetical protein